jgi:hypothetical protein
MYKRQWMGVLKQECCDLAKVISPGVYLRHDDDDDYDNDDADADEDDNLRK